MKKICLIFLILSMLLLLSSCANSNRAKFVTPFEHNQISYNGNIYNLVLNDSDFELHYEYKIRNELDVSKRVGISAFLSTIWLCWDWEFEDNILRVYTPGAHISYFFKEGFEFPKYNEVLLGEILIDGKSSVNLIESLKNRDITWNDIIDYDTTILLEDVELYSCHGTLKNYSIDLLTGRFCLTVFDDIVYIQTDRELNDKLFYKISDEYQQIFKTEIESCN